MNYMEQVAQMLGVELGEEFYLSGFSYKYKITKDGMFFYHEGSHEWYITRRDLSDILTGEYKIIKKPILDEAEKEYLSNIIKPFCDIVECIAKHEHNDEYEYINIIYIDHAFGRFSIEFPCFKKGTMYKGMEIEKDYTLEELGL